MYLHFEDWSHAPSATYKLENRGIPHNGTIIKVFASSEDPRTVLNSPQLKVLEIDDSPFEDEVYEYAERGTFTGLELEAYLEKNNLSELGKRTVRAIFRFSYGEGFSQNAMGARTEKGWFFDHPFAAIHGADKKKFLDREANMHLDIFYPPSLEHLREVVNFEDKSLLLYHRAGQQWRRGLVNHIPEGIPVLPPAFRK